jgi:hypothetical protein
VLCQPTPEVVLKRARPASPDVEPRPPSLPTRALPLPLWEEHLLPLLRCKDAARLACTCTAFRDVVREHFRSLDKINFKHLQAALTAFPRARTVAVDETKWRYDAEGREALVQWLREGGRGRLSREDDVRGLL